MWPAFEFMRPSFSGSLRCSLVKATKDFLCTKNLIQKRHIPTALSLGIKHRIPDPPILAVPLTTTLLYNTFGCATIRSGSESLQRSALVIAIPSRNGKIALLVPPFDFVGRPALALVYRDHPRCSTSFKPKPQRAIDHLILPSASTPISRNLKLQGRPCTSH